MAEKRIFLIFVDSDLNLCKALQVRAFSFARIFMKICLVVKYSLINISFKFHKDPPPWIGLMGLGLRRSFRTKSCVTSQSSIVHFLENQFYSTDVEGIKITMGIIKKKIEGQAGAELTYNFDTIQINLILYILKS